MTDESLWPRLQLPVRESMTEEQGRIYDGSLARFGGLYGPRIPLIMAPELNGPWNDQGAALHRGSLPADVREFAILVTARFWRAEFISLVHRGRARRAGLPDDVIDGVCVGAGTDAFPVALAAVANFCEALLERRPLSDEMYDAARRALGQRGVVQLTVLISHYTAVAFSLVAHAAPLPPEGTLDDRS